MHKAQWLWLWQKETRYKVGPLYPVCLFLMTEKKKVPILKGSCWSRYLVFVQENKEPFSLIEWIWRRLKVDDMIGFRADSVLDPLLSCFYPEQCKRYILNLIIRGICLSHGKYIYKPIIMIIYDRLPGTVDSFRNCG